MSKPKSILPLTIEATFPDAGPESAFLAIRQDDAKLTLIIPKSAAALLVIASDDLIGQPMAVTLQLAENREPNARAR